MSPAQALDLLDQSVVGQFSIVELAWSLGAAVGVICWYWLARRSDRLERARRVARVNGVRQRFARIARRNDRFLGVYSVLNLLIGLAAGTVLQPPPHLARPEARVAGHLVTLALVFAQGLVDYIAVHNVFDYRAIDAMVRQGGRAQ